MIYLESILKPVLKPVVAIIIAVILLAFGCSKRPASTESLVKIQSKDYGDTEYLMVIEELERSEKTSKVKVTYKKMGSSVGHSMWIAIGMSEIAKARGFGYFTNLKEWDSPDGGRIYIAGFTNVPDANIHAEFGHEYTLENEFGQKRIFMSTLPTPSKNKQIEHEDSNRPR